MFLKNAIKTLESVVTYSTYYNDDHDVKVAQAMLKFHEAIENYDKYIITRDDLVEQLAKYSSSAEITGHSDEYLGISYLTIVDGDKIDFIITNKW